MSNRLDLLVIEDDQNICKNYKTLAKDYENIFLIDTTNSTSTGLKLVSEYSPNAIILDLELHMGYGNGISFLQELSNLDLKVRPFVVVVTNNISQITHDIAHKLGADFLITKNQEDYSEKMVLDFLLSVLSINSNNKFINNTQAIVGAEYSNNLKNRIAKELDLVGVSPKLKGRAYLCDAIEIAVDKRVPKISSIIASKYSKSDASVERAMETAINRTWRNTDIETLETHYTAYINPCKGVPTVTEFIYYYANKISESL